MNYAEIIKQRVTCREMLESMGVSVNRSGFAICPFHNEHTASLKVYSEPKRGWYCHACHRGGDVIDMAQLFYSTDFRGALDRLNEQFNLDLPIHQRLTREQRRRMREERKHIEQDRAERERRARAATRAYDAAIDAYRENQRTIEETRPRALYEPWSDAFCEALRQQDSVLDELEYTEERWREARAR